MAKSIKAIDEELKVLSLADLPTALINYKSDERKGVHNLIKKYNKKIADYQKLVDHFKVMNQFEEELKGQGCSYIAGIDEVGRGPLAGPVVSAVVILPKNHGLLGLDDSKKLSAKKREELYDQILEVAVDYAVGIVDVQTIDEINILEATYVAMGQAINKLEQKPDHILVDAVTIPGIDIAQTPIIGGDGKSNTIAAASIVAKVTRDRMMVSFADLYPEYYFQSNKGYGSSDHVEALKLYGPCPLHRQSFIGKIINQ